MEEEKKQERTTWWGVKEESVKGQWVEKNRVINLVDREQTEGGGGGGNQLGSCNLETLSTTSIYF